MTGHGDPQPPSEHRLEEVEPGSTPHLDETVGPHSPASDDVRLTANDVTTEGVIEARRDIQDRGRAAENTPPPA